MFKVGKGVDAKFFIPMSEKHRQIKTFKNNEQFQFGFSAFWKSHIKLTGVQIVALVFVIAMQ